MKSLDTVYEHYIGGCEAAIEDQILAIRRPGKGVNFAETLSFSVDPHIKVPCNRVIDFTIQRELPWNLLLEVCYVGRLARDLYVIRMFLIDDGNWEEFSL